MKTVLVTGGTVRIGLAIAERLRRDGWRVITSSHRTGRALTPGIAVEPAADIVADLSEPMGAEKLYAATLQLLDGKPPDALVNNAALFTGDEEALKAVNLEAPKRLTMMMAGREKGVGAVVNILDASIGHTDTQASAGYRETKESLQAFTLSSAMMFSASLRVNGVAPGAVLAPTGVHETAGARLLDRRPMAEDVAAAVSFLLSAKSVTGVVIPVDSGSHLVPASRHPHPHRDIT